jgi:hypothetical protein
MTAALMLEQTGPVALDDADLIAAIRTAYPNWQTEAPSLRQIREVAVCGQSKAIRLRDLLGTQTAMSDQTPARQITKPVRQIADRPTVRIVKPVQTIEADQTAEPEVTPDQTVQVSSKEIADQTPSSGSDQTVDLQVSSKKDEPARAKSVSPWPILILALPAFVAVWSGWVGLGKLTGFGVVNLLPGLVKDGDWSTIDTAITLPIGVEAYAAYALWVWLSGRGSDLARRFARASAITSLVVGAAGQIAYHLLAAPETAAPWPITMAVACLPVAVLGMGAALAHLIHADRSA